MEFTHVYTRPKKKIIGQVIVLEHKWRPCKMCDRVRQKLGHTNPSIIDLKKKDIKHTSGWTSDGLEICVLEKKLLFPEEFLLALFLNITHERNQLTTTTNKKRGPVSIASGVNYKCNTLCIRVRRWIYHQKIINNFWKI